MGRFGRTHAVELHQVAAKLLAQPLGLLLGVVLHFDFQKQVRTAHIPYTKSMACAICETRRPRRACPGVRGEICSICCGTEREVSVECPFDCVYLQEARTHEKPAAMEDQELPNQDIKLTEGFLRENEPLMVALSQGLVRALDEAPGIVDFDVREALDALIRTYRTLESGVYYETRPSNPLANHVCNQAQHAVTELRTREREQLGMTRTRDADVLGMLVFMQRLELDRNNGRRRGRAFLDLLRTEFGAAAPAEAPPSIIVP